MTNIKSTFAIVFKDNIHSMHFKARIVMIIIYVTLILLCKIEANNGVIDKIILVSIPIDFKFFLLFFPTIIVLEFIICLPKIFIDTINKNRILFYLSNSISRYNFINFQILSMIIFCILCLILTYIFLIISVYIKTNIFEVFILITGLNIIFQIIGLYLIVIWSALKYNSFAFCITIQIVYSFINGILSGREVLFRNVGIDNEFLNFAADIIYFITPQIAEISTSLILKNDIEYVNIIGVVISLIPIWLLSLYEFNKKQF